jgi:uncharacterized membrane protein
MTRMEEWAARVVVIGSAAFVGGIWAESWTAGVAWFLTLWAIVVLGREG